MSRSLPQSLVCIGLLLGCREQPAPAPAEAPGSVVQQVIQRPTSVGVTTYGQLRAMMHENRTEPVVTLSRIATPNLYALGALSELRGEVTIIDGNMWLGYPTKDDTVRIESTPTSDETAALLVAANVDRWKEVPIQEDIAWENLDASIEKLAHSTGVDVQQAFPFLLDGEFSRAEWHVIDGSKLTGGPSSHKEHAALAVKASAALPKAKVLGFFSKHHQGVFTHHGENTHLHLVDEHQRLTGHVDLLAVKAGTVLKVPL